ncbi:MAG: hypothetical protein E5X74_19485 [Mesorhizobium sp.]|uniref:hypothetical protein n=1 Tax=Mesorhizobium sp. TaxID=1871066 RepID=UPI001206DF06|nr:hypothetical protein [Mesorhizobium sp.]TIO75648.1 MAG: hypothetical protein E5X75_18415 [Mesorhizobium sp.]TIO83655.1 MAG: hypothetical protein E5X74_19485 [Mesorhizobium sp.]
MSRNFSEEDLKAFQYVIERMLPIFQESHAKWQSFITKVPDLPEQLRITIDTLGRAGRTIIELATEIYQVDRALEPTGWLPHYTTPFDAIRDNPDVKSGKLKDLLETHYRENWDAVEQQFLDRLQLRDVHEETKAAFREALCAHRHGLYRAVVRSLFPEIEEEVRKSFFEGSTKVSLAGQSDLREVAAQMPAGYVVPSGTEWRLFKKLTDHMYLRVDDENRVSFASDPVPNRHAALHGLVAYSTLQSSVNALIMADYALQIITSIKMLQRLSGQERVSSSVLTDQLAPVASPP